MGLQRRQLGVESSAGFPLPRPNAPLLARPPARSEDAKRLCANPTLQGESRDQVGCRR